MGNGINFMLDDIFVEDIGFICNNKSILELKLFAVGVRMYGIDLASYAWCLYQWHTLSSSL
ncbi:MAG: hypothetical protein Q9M36_03885 [Sulfurovum sp.]|nr:hypothetical protein [Sulfurovum sp.]